MSSAASERTSSAVVSRGAQETDVGQLIAEYESALSAALAERDQIRAARAFDLADRLQHRLLRGAGTGARWKGRVRPAL